MALRDFRARTDARPSAQGVDAATSYIDSSCELSGSLRFRESVRIDGSIEGQIQGEKTVVIGASGSVRADIKCESIVIFGQVEGDIHARRKITFHKGARVNGQMKASGIVVEEGSKFSGCIVIGEEEPAAVKPLPTSAAKPGTNRSA